MRAPLRASTSSTEMVLVGSLLLPCLNALPSAFRSGMSKSRISCSRAALPFVVGIDRFKRRGGLLRSAEAEHALAIGKERAGAGVLHDDGFAAGQVTERAIAHPGVLESHARPLGATELTTRPLDVSLIHLRRGGDFARMADAPTPLLQIAAFLGVS